MVFIPAWVTNVLFLINVYLFGFQHVQLRRPNPITNIQFVMMAFSLVMIVIVALYNRVDPWLSLIFFLAAVASLGWMIRQPLKSFE
jgi:hypothetical protein